MIKSSLIPCEEAKDWKATVVSYIRDPTDRASPEPSTADLPTLACSFLLVVRLGRSVIQLNSLTGQVRQSTAREVNQCASSGFGFGGQRYLR